ncbi:MAG: type II methionyl aminopeptidase [Fervidicoccaceae archaeon]
MEIIDEEVLKKIALAGKILATVKREARGLIKPHRSYLEIAEKIESRIRELGGEPAFPCNLSWGSEAAHYSPLLDDTRTVPPEGIMKVDVGVHIDGYPVDAAFSVDLSGENQLLIQAVEEALERALEVVGPGVKVKIIGEVIEHTLKRYGVKPVRNLAGHTMSRYRLHAGLSIPNTSSGGSGSLGPGTIVALEPFATTGIGYVVNGDAVTIFSFTKPYVKAKDGGRDDIFANIYSQRSTLPFTERWYARLGDLASFRKGLADLRKKKYLTEYPVLIEATGHQVSQAEETVVILKNEAIVVTR